MKSLFVEDIFVDFIDLISSGSIRMQPHDRNAAYNFYQDILLGKQFTEKQGQFIIKILFKYRKQAKDFLDYETAIENPAWKQPFRTIDKSKKAWVEIDEISKPWICLKFPFELKDAFEQEFVELPRGVNIWNPDRRIRQISLYDCNIMQVYKFITEHKFEIDDSFMDAYSYVEEIWQNQEYYTKASYIENNSVHLENASVDALEYFDKNKTDNIDNDLILAKLMSFPYKGTVSNRVEKIASSKHNEFWIKDLAEFIHFSFQINCKVCFILDRASDTIDWLTNLSKVLDNMNFDKSLFRVCFRKDNKQYPEFNSWISEQGFGGKIASAKFLIFNHKPAKWLFKNENDVIIYASNGLYPTTDSTTGAILNNAPLVFFVGDIKPTAKKDRVIEL